MNRNAYVNMPVAAVPYVVLANDTNIDGNPLVLTTWNYGEGKFTVDGVRRDGTLTQLYGHWIAICK